MILDTWAEAGSPIFLHTLAGRIRWDVLLAVVTKGISSC